MKLITLLVVLFYYEVSIIIKKLLNYNKNKFLNDNLSSLSKKYTELFFRTQKVKISASVNDLIIDKSIRS